MNAPMLAVLTAALPAALLALPHDWRFLPLHAGLLGLTTWLAWRGPAIDRLMGRSPAFRMILVAAAGLLLCGVLFRDLPRTTWGVIDDHALHGLIGPGRDRLPSAEVVPALARHPEFGAPTLSQTRYRPGYYAFYLAQAAAWGRDARPWFLLRMAIFAASVALGFDLLRRWLGAVGAATAVAVFAGLWMWSEIIGRLGSGETYAAPACLGFVACGAAILRARGRSGPGPWAGLTLSALVAIGCKENFVVLAPLTVLLNVIDRRRGGGKWPAVIASGIVCLAAAAVTGIVAVGITNNGGRDVYQRSVGIAGLLDVADPAARRTLRKLLSYGLPLAAGATWAAIAWARLPRTAADELPSARHRRTAVAVALVLLLVALSQLAFYRGDVFKKGRYDLPFVPVVLLIGIGLLHGASRLPAATSRRRHDLRRLLVPGTLAIAATAIGGDHTRAVTREYAAATNVFFARVESLVAACRATPTRPVAFMLPADPIVCYEPVLSVAEYLRSFGVENPFHLCAADRHDAPQAHPAATSWQARELEAVAREGGGGFRPGADLPADGPAAIRVRFPEHELRDPADAFRIE